MAEDKKGAELSPSLEALQAENAELKAQLDELTGLLEQLQHGGKPEEVTVKVGKSTYVVRCGVKVKGVLYSKEELAANADLCKTLVERNSTVLIKK